MRGGASSPNRPAVYLCPLWEPQGDAGVVLRLFLCFFFLDQQIDHRKGGGGDDQQERHGIDDRGGAIPHLQIEVDRQGGFGPHQKQGGVEVFKAHQKGDGATADQGRAKIGQGDVADDLKPGGPKVQRGFLKASIKFPEPGGDDQQHEGGYEGELAQHHQPEAGTKEGNIDAEGVLEIDSQAVGGQQNRDAENNPRDHQRGQRQKPEGAFAWELLLFKEKGASGPDNYRKKGHPERCLGGNPERPQVRAVVQKACALRAFAEKPVEGETIPGQRREVGVVEGENTGDDQRGEQKQIKEADIDLEGSGVASLLRQGAYHDKALPNSCLLIFSPAQMMSELSSNSRKPKAAPWFQLKLAMNWL